MHHEVFTRPPGVLRGLESYEGSRHRIIPVQRQRPCFGDQGCENPEFRSVIVDRRDSLPPKQRIEMDERLVRVQGGTREAKKGVPNRVVLLVAVTRRTRVTLPILLLAVGRQGLLT